MLSSRTFFVALLFSLVALAARSTLARADVLPPPGDCEKKVEGDACTDYEGKAGACGTITYTRTFTPPTPNAQTETSQRSYYGCKTGATPTTHGKRCSVSAVGADSDAGEGYGLLFIAIAMGALARRSHIRGSV